MNIRVQIIDDGDEIALRIVHIDAKYDEIRDAIENRVVFDLVRADKDAS